MMCLKCARRRCFAIGSSRMGIRLRWRKFTTMRLRQEATAEQHFALDREIAVIARDRRDLKNRPSHVRTMVTLCAGGRRRSCPVRVCIRAGQNLIGAVVWL